MPYAQVDQFAADKASNTIAEEGIAPSYIRAYHALQGRKVWKIEKNLGDLAQQRKYDLLDGMGITWEVKSDHIWGTTGKVYIELQAFEASLADKYLIFAGKAYVVPKTALREEFQQNTALTPGGDNDVSLGLLLPLETLEEISEEVIVL